MAGLQGAMRGEAGWVEGDRAEKEEGASGYPLMVVWAPTGQKIPKEE